MDNYAHATTCVWERTTTAECEYRETHHYCPHPEHACTCPPRTKPLNQHLSERMNTVNNVLGFLLAASRDGGETGLQACVQTLIEIAVKREIAGTLYLDPIAPAEPPPIDAHRCPHCGRRMVSEFDEDVGFWRECVNCDYREQVSSAPAEPEGEQEAGPAASAPALLKELIDNYVEHRETCPSMDYPSAVCDCGLVQNMEQLTIAVCTVTPPETPVVARELSSRLIKLAAAVIAGHDFISPYADDNPKTTPRAILDQAEKQRERLRLWAIEIRAIADKLSAAIITRYLGAAQPHCWHCGVLLEEVESKPRCDQCPADCDDETCSAFGCAPNAAATTPPSETAVGGKAERRSNYFSNAAIDKGFPAHIGRDNKAHYSDGTVLPAAGDDEGEWCDDCRAYTHTPNCPSYTGRNQ